MLKPNLLKEIGFSAGDCQKYYLYYGQAGREIEMFAFDAMRLNKDFGTVMKSMHERLNGKLHPYTQDLLFLLSCSGYLKQDYDKNGIPEEIFIESMKDIRYKLEECKKVKNIFGVFVAYWHEGFFRLQRLAFGRLQFDILRSHSKSIEVKGFEIFPDTFALRCHIPSSGPLYEQEVYSSLKAAYGFFKSEIKTKILPVFCDSWLLYPQYAEVFNKNAPNISKFISHFFVYSTSQTEDFIDALRIFGTADIGNTSALPQQTRLQKGFVSYINCGGTFGCGNGVLLFNGEDIL